MNFYLRVLNPAVAISIFALCYWASIGEEAGNPLGFLAGGISTYFFAKGLFCASALFLLGRILLGLFSDERRATESRSSRAQIVASLAIFGFLAGSFAGLLLLVVPEKAATTSNEPVIDPTGIRIVDPYEIRVTKYFTIGGKLRNDGPSDWESVVVIANVRLAGKLVAECTEKLTDRGEVLEAGSEREFLNRCGQLYSYQIDGPLEYALRVEAKLPAP
jgi:hypothetical protein